MSLRTYLQKIQSCLSRIFDNKILQWGMLCLKAIICVWVTQDSALKQLEWGYPVKIPILKYVYFMLKDITGWGMENVFFFLGICCVLYFAGQSEIYKNKYLTAVSAFFAVCTVVGRSYYETHSWIYLSHGRIQFGLSVFVMVGYYFLYKSAIAFCSFCIRKGKLLEVRESRNKVESFLFEKHPFGGPLLVIVLFSLPYLIFFFPGTLHWDAVGQILSYFDMPDYFDTKHPFINTMLMGGCMELGRNVFGSDNIGFFFYTFPQYVAQWFVFAYGVFLLCRMKSPMLFRWGALAYFNIFPLWKIWGYTMAKDTWYYIWLLLFVLLLLDIHVGRYEKVQWWQGTLLVLAPAGACLSKGNGLFVLLLFLFVAIILDRRLWKFYLVCIFTVTIPMAVQNYVLMPAYVNGVTQGPAGETMSIPLQQTARYLLVHPDDVTEEEKAVLQEVFTCSLEEVASSYDYEISDPVKAKFISYPTKEQLRAYYQVWFAQFCRHPATYLQAFINQIYGFFYPNREMFNDQLARWRIGPDQYWDQGMDVYFEIEDRTVRDWIEQSALLLYRMPVFGMLFSAGFNNYVLIGCICYLLSKKKRKELFLLLPAALVVLFNLFSPVNAYLRYMLPEMAMLPFLIAWCYYVTHPENSE